MSKVCSRCKESKPIEAFNKRMQSSDGFNPRCRSCTTEYAKKHYEKHKEKIRESAREYNAKNNEEIKKRRSEHRAKNKEKIREYAKKHYEKHKEKAKEYRTKNREKIAEAQRKWRQANVEKIQTDYREWAKNNNDKTRTNNALRRAARIQRTPCWLTEDDKVLIQRKYTLASRKTESTGERWVVDHILPLQGKLVSGLHVPANLRVIKYITNARKSNKFVPV